jgi:hypothetical protein
MHQRTQTELEKKGLVFDIKKYGIAEEVFNVYYDLLNGRPNTKSGKYCVNLLPTTVHIYFGSVIGALPNSRQYKTRSAYCVLRVAGILPAIRGRDALDTAEL